MPSRATADSVPIMRLRGLRPPEEDGALKIFKGMPTVTANPEHTGRARRGVEEEEEEEVEFIPSGHWTGKHNSLSRGVEGLQSPLVTSRRDSSAVNQPTVKMSAGINVAFDLGEAGMPGEHAEAGEVEDALPLHEGRPEGVTSDDSGQPGDPSFARMSSDDAPSLELDAEIGTPSPM
jgi:hypothetical protein